MALFVDETTLLPVFMPLTPQPDRLDPQAVNCRLAEVARVRSAHAPPSRLAP